MVWSRTGLRFPREGECCESFWVISSGLVISRFTRQAVDLTGKTHIKVRHFSSYEVTFRLAGSILLVSFILCLSSTAVEDHYPVDSAIQLSYKRLNCEPVETF